MKKGREKDGERVGRREGEGNGREKAGGQEWHGTRNGVACVTGKS